MTRERCPWYSGGQMRKHKTIAERFWPKVDRPDNTACWRWTGSLGSRGYGQINVGGRPIAAHRVAMMLTHGSIPAGAFVCHACDNPVCVNPTHLFLGTQSDNMRDCTAKGRNPGNGNDRKTHCPSGHEYTDANTHVDARGARHCRRCHRERARDRRREHSLG